MLTGFDNNPFRILGVYADASVKQITASQEYLKAYLYVKKAPVCRFDNCDIFQITERTITTLEEAKKKIWIPADKLSYALWWFFQPEDETLKAMLETLSSNSISSIVKQFRAYGTKSFKKKPYPLWLLQDLFLLEFLNGDYINAVSFADKLYSRPDELAAHLGCETVAVNQSELFTSLKEHLIQAGVESPEDIMAEYQIKTIIKSISRKDSIEKLRESLRDVCGLVSEIHSRQPDLARTLSDKFASRLISVERCRYTMLANFRNNFRLKALKAYEQDRVDYRMFLNDAVEVLYCSSEKNSQMVSTGNLLEKGDDGIEALTYIVFSIPIACFFIIAILFWSISGLLKNKAIIKWIEPTLENLFVLAKSVIRMLLKTYLVFILVLIIIACFS